MKQTLYISYLLVSLFLLQGCSQYLHQPLRISTARLGAETVQFQELTSLPEPQEKVVAAVYKFRDQTGQYKNIEAGTSWSTAVTQGATSILLRAMEESGWFIPIEREGLSNLLNERKIIRSSMANFSENDNSKLLPPLVFAGVILEGGIISFDSNIMTGGIGARYFGTGTSSKYREDRVTIYLRAVSTSNGRILKTVYTSKTILSQQIDIGVFRFVSTRRLLEAETGFTYNEPAEMAVKEAIEKAVYSLIIEGIIGKLWQPKDEEKTDSILVKPYLIEKKINEDINVFGNSITERRGRVGVGVHASTLLYEGDYEESSFFPGGVISLQYFSNRPFSIGINTGLGQLGTSNNEFKATIGYSDFGIRYNFFSLLKTTPYLRLGVGVATELENNLDKNITIKKNSHAIMSGEFGMEYLTTNKIGINASLSYQLLMSDNLDKLPIGKYDDSIWGAHLGIIYYFMK